MTGSGAYRIAHYRVEQELKRDALGFVFRAFDERLERPVVLRVVRAARAYSGAELAEVRRRIQARVRAAAQHHHPGLVTIYEYRQLTETDLVVMEWVDGEAPADGVRWTVLDTASLLARIAEALAFVHASGHVHGHIDRANIRLRPDGRVTLLDFGMPKLEDDFRDPDPRGDVRELARVACALLVPAAANESVDRLRQALEDPVVARAHFGFLAPVLSSALREPPGFEDAASFRDAVADAFSAATHRPVARAAADAAGPTESAAAPAQGARPRDDVPEELAPLPVAVRIALPSDLASRVEAAANGELAPDAGGRAPWPGTERVPRPPGRRLALAVTVLFATAFVAWLALKAPSSSPAVAAGATAEPLSASAPASRTAPAAAAPRPIEATAVRPDDSARSPQFTAWVRANPPGTRFREVGGSEREWADAAELSVAAGDSIILAFSRPGHVPVRAAFRGSRLVVSLLPDSVLAHFEANLPVDVFLVAGESARRLGTTPFTTRLPSGTHRILFRSPGQPDWIATHAMPEAGSAYRVTKTDYVTAGSLVTTVAGAWARVSLDGGVARETPARFDSLRTGYHTLTVTRAGFATIIDTVLIHAGQVTRRQYTLRR